MSDKQPTAVSIQRLMAGELCIVYQGDPESLFQMGAVTDRELTPIGRGNERRDADGDRCLVSKGRSNRLYVRYTKREDKASHLPGVIEWLAAEAGVPLSVVNEVTQTLERIRSVGA